MVFETRQGRHHSSAFHPGALVHTLACNACLPLLCFQSDDCAAAGQDAAAPVPVEASDPLSVSRLSTESLQVDFTAAHLTTLAAFHTEDPRLHDATAQLHALSCVAAGLPKEGLALQEIKRRAVAAEVCLDWVLGVLRTHTGNEDLAVHGSLILRRVSWASKDGEAMMRMEEVVTQTLRAYRGSAAVVDNCLVCLRNLACHKANKAVLAERALPLVVDLLMEQGPVRTTTADAALWFLSNLAEVTEVRVSSVGCSEPVAPQAS
jgi:hypothetical protein